MTVRAHDLSDMALKMTFTVAAAQSTTKGLGVIFSGADTDIATVGANGKAFAIALETKAAGEKCECALLGHAVIPVKVGTGGATRGEFAVAAADGLIDQTLGGGTTVKYIEGVFLQTGVVGDTVGLLVNKFAAGAA